MSSPAFNKENRWNKFSFLTFCEFILFNYLLNVAHIGSVLKVANWLLAHISKLLIWGELLMIPFQQLQHLCSKVITQLSSVIIQIKNRFTGVELTGTLCSSPWPFLLPPGYFAPRLPTCSPSAPDSPGRTVYWSSPSGKRRALSACAHTNRLTETDRETCTN